MGEEQGKKAEKEGKKDKEGDRSGWESRGQGDGDGRCSDSMGGLAGHLELWPTFFFLSATQNGDDRYSVPWELL